MRLIFGIHYLMSITSICFTNLSVVCLCLSVLCLSIYTLFRKHSAAQSMTSMLCYVIKRFGLAYRLRHCIFSSFTVFFAFLCVLIFSLYNLQWRRSYLKAAKSFPGHQGRKAGQLFRSPFFFSPLPFCCLPLEAWPLNLARESGERCKLPSGV